MWNEIIDKTEAVLFDLDGTVVDSMWIWKQIDIDYFARCKMKMPEDYQKQIEGLSFYETAKYTRDRYLPHRQVQDLMDDWNEMAYEHYVSDVLPKEGVIIFLEHLRKRGIKTGIATSNSRILCEATLKKNGLISYFDSILTGEEKNAGKPAPDIYIASAKKLGAAPGGCLVFEDLCNGIRAGKAAGMTVVTIYDEYSAYQWDEKCDLADHHIMSYREITDEIC